MKLQKLITNVQQWSTDRGLDKADSKKQMLKLYEEFGELAGGLARGDQELIKDSIGDVVVVLIILAQQQEVMDISDLRYQTYRGDMMLNLAIRIGFLSERITNNREPNLIAEEIEMIIAGLRLVDKNTFFDDCLQQAWNEIKDRKGKLIDGVWVKEEDLK
nr:MAG TPA: NTP-PPase-like protein [Caudoviricetes sp.]